MENKDLEIKEWDVCMLHINKFPNAFVRINYIWADEKKGWWCVNLTKMALPLESWTWILDDSHINGAEFEMSGTKFQLQILNRPNLENAPTVEQPVKKKVEVTDVNDIVKTLFTPSKVLNFPTKNLNNTKQQQHNSTTTPDDPTAA